MEYYLLFSACLYLFWKNILEVERKKTMIISKAVNVFC